MDSGTTFSPYIEISVQRKNTPYEVITGMFRYSRSFELYCFPADFFKSICENDDISELNTRISAYLVNLVMILLSGRNKYHSDNNYHAADDLLGSELFVEEQYAPHHSPYDRDRSAGISST